MPGRLRAWMGHQGDNGCCCCCCDKGHRRPSGGYKSVQQQERERGGDRAILGGVLRCPEGETARSRSDQVYRRAVQGANAERADYARVCEEAAWECRESGGRGD